MVEWWLAGGNPEEKTRITISNTTSSITNITWYNHGLNPRLREEKPTCKTNLWHDHLYMLFVFLDLAVINRMRSGFRRDFASHCLPPAMQLQSPCRYFLLYFCSCAIQRPSQKAHSVRIIRVQVLLFDHSIMIYRNAGSRGDIASRETLTFPNNPFCTPLLHSGSEVA
jgi:hypothetical protein